MAEDKERESEQSAAAAAWGTWEELLLACAVKRHGFKDWSSVAMEVQARTSLLVTARNCELKFLDLKRRFTSFQNDTVLSQNGGGIGDTIDNAVPWLDELRKLRVAELRREVHGYDVSISSLQLKVKRLEEERERGLRDREAGTAKPDLKTESRERRSENDNKLFGEPDYRSGPDGTAAKPPPTATPAIPVEDSDREDFSVNQSNSTGSKSGNRKSTAENAKSETKPDFAGSFRPGPNRRAAEPAGPQSDDGSTETVAKNPRCDVSETKKKPPRVGGDSSEAQSNGGETAATRESSEVQSSASLTGRMKRKRLLRKEISGGSSGNEPRRTAAVKSRRFDEILQMLRAHKHGFLFESRLRSQESEEYKRVVRQHLDLGMVQDKINSGSYSSSSLAFYRDLLLLCNNAVTFFPKFSKESVAACELRLLVSNELKKSLQIIVRTDPSPEVVDSSPTVPSRLKGADLERSQSLLAKQKSSVPIIVCRKRSKISAKLSSTGLGEKDRSSNDEKSTVDLKPTVKKASNAVEDHGTTKDGKVKEKPVTGARSMRRSNDSATNSSGPSIKKQNSNSGWKPGSANETETPTPDKKKPETVALEKKRSAADFLKRIKQNSPAETIKRNSRGGTGSSSGNASAEQKKGSSTKSDKGKERASSRQSNDKKRVKDDASPSKRSVGRPPKKAADAEPVPTKKVRDGGGTLKRPKKRARR